MTVTIKEAQHNWYMKNKTTQIKRAIEYQKKNPTRVKKWQKHSRNKGKLIRQELIINGCAICGYDKCNAALEFHHIIKKNKLFNLNVNTISHYSDKKIINELNKCILLCSNCHREIEEQERL